MANEKNSESPPAEQGGDWRSVELQDDRNIDRILNGYSNGESGGPLKLDFDHDAPIDQTGKADDAEDFENISDDDLPEEEQGQGGSMSIELPGLTDDGGTSNDADDLFGDGPSSPTDPILGPPSPGPRVHDDEAVGDTQPTDVGLSFPGMSFDPEPHLNGAENQDYDIPAPAETVEDLVKTAFPDFKQGRTLVFHKLLPPKQARWKEKRPAKKPKRLVTSKLTLELDQDTVTSFRLPETSTASRQESLEGLVRCDSNGHKDAEDVYQFDIDKDSDSETVDGRTLRDFELACSNWYTLIEELEQNFEKYQAEEIRETESRKRQIDDEDDEWNAEFLMDVV